jgi:peptidoglycan/LPS O-acetylase OafA/YrhL
MTHAKEPAGLEIRHRLPALRALTSIRLFAAMYVVIYHQAFSFRILTWWPLATRVIASGYTSVTLFFVLSGFILAYNYGTVRSRKDFWIARFARIYPVYFISLSSSLLLLIVGRARHPALLSMLLSFTVLQAWYTRYAKDLNVYGWTLSDEAFFYAVFPFLLPFLESLRRRYFLVFQLAYLMFLGLPIVLIRFPAAAHGTRILVDWLTGPIPIWRVNEFVLGVYAGIQYRRAVTRRAATDAPAGPPSWVLGPVAVAIFVLLSLAPSEVCDPLRVGSLSVLYAVLLWSLASCQWRWLTNRWMQIGGEISYSIYILQLPVSFVVYGITKHVLPRWLHNPVFYIAVLLVTSYCIFRWIEIPARVAIRRVLTGRRVEVEVV